MALLVESVLSFFEIWIEYLCDLARSRTPVEEVDPKDREVWPGIARMWYDKIADTAPNVGWTYHDLRGSPGQQQDAYAFPRSGKTSKLMRRSGKCESFQEAN